MANAVSCSVLFEQVLVHEISVLDFKETNKFLRLLTVTNSA